MWLCSISLPLLTVAIHSHLTSHGGTFPAVRQLSVSNVTRFQWDHSLNMLHLYGTTRSNITLVKSKPSSEARHCSPVVSSNVHQVSHPCYRKSSGIHFYNVELAAKSLCCIAFAMVWWPFLLQLTSNNRLQPTPEGSKPDRDRSCAIQTHTTIPSFLLQFACGILYRSTFANCRFKAQLNWVQLM